MKSNYQKHIEFLFQKTDDLLMSHFGSAISFSKKEGNSLVSEIDIKANEIILSFLIKEYPTHNIISEESKKIENNSEYTWFIDPIDGTHNYLRGIPFFGTSIALSKKNEVIFGAISLPYFKEHLFAIKNEGAFCNGKKIVVSSNKTELDHCTIAFDSSSKAKLKKLEILPKLSNVTYNERVFGSAVIALSFVAQGKIDAFIIQSTHSWDIAAGNLIVSEAKGLATTLDNVEWEPKDGSFLITNKKIHEELLILAR